MARQRVAPGVYKVASGVYDIHVSTGRGVDGRYGKVTKRIRGTLTDAKSERGRMLVAVAEGTLRVVEPATMKELQDRYMATKASLSKASREQYAYLWAKLEPLIGTIDVKKLRALDLDHAYVVIGKDVSPNTTMKCHKHVSALLNRAVSWELVPRNVALSATPPSPVPFNITPPTPADLVSLVDAALKQEPQFGALVYLGATTGARRGELAGLRWGDVDFVKGTARFAHQPNGDGTLRTTKNKRQRVVVLDRGTVRVLRRQRALCDQVAKKCAATINDECFVFSSVPGNAEPFRVDGLTWRFRRLAKSTGIKSRLHDLRHAQATSLLNSGISPVVAADRLGQSVEVLLSTYGHTDQVQEKRAAAAGALQRSKHPKEREKRSLRNELP